MKYEYVPVAVPVAEKEEGLSWVNWTYSCDLEDSFCFKN